MRQSSFDVIVIGAGPGGYVAAIRAAQLGLKTAVVEREHLGGICLNWGCIPAKTLLRSAEILELMRRAREFGLSAENVGFDLAAVVERSRSVARQLTQGVAHLLKKHGVTVIEGSAEISARDEMLITAGDDTTTRYTAGDIIVATGARARELPGMKSDGRLIWTYRDALIPDITPGRLLVIGSGAIGIEFASFYRTLGAETTVVEIQDHILPSEDVEISNFACQQFARQGIAFLKRASVVGLECGTDSVACGIEQNGETRLIEVDRVISAVGIIGNVEGLGLETLGVAVDSNRIVVDLYCRTAVPGIWAIGDVAGAPWLAHKASHEGIMVAEQIAGNEVRPFRPTDVPRCTYSHPQIASVGLTEPEARNAGYSIRIGRFPFIGNGKAIALGEPGGLVKTIFDRQTGELLGAHMVGVDVTELIAGYALGRTLETTGQELMHTIFPHPTLSETMRESVLSADGRAIHY